MSMTTDTGESAAALLERATQLRLADNFDGAREVCHTILGMNSSDAGAMCLLGVCDLETGQIADGAAWLDRAEAINPQLPQLHLYRSIQMEAAGDLPAAIESAQRATELAAGRFDVWGRLGDLAGQAEDFALAAMALDKAINAEPDHPAVGPIALRLAGARMECGERDQAERALGLAEANGLPGHPEILRIRSVFARQDADWEQMERHASAWLAAATQDPDARSALALAQSQRGYYRRAVETYRPVVEAEPGNAANWAALGRLVLGARDVAEARSCFERALELDARCAEATFGLARVFTMLGDLEQAELMCRRTLDIDPAQLEAYGQLTEVTSGRLGDEEIEALKREIAVPDIASDRLAIGLFALGDACHRREMRDEAFSYWQRANETKKRQHAGGGYDRARQEARTDRLMTLFDTDLADAPKPEADAVTPIFIVGMPRSGTTLIEAAISAHEDAAGAGELSGMPFILNAFLDWAEETGFRGGAIPEDKLEAWREQYLGQYGQIETGGARFVVDKQPANFEAVGLIRQLFPASPVIHIRRKPIETGFSIFRRNFSRLWPFAHDLEDIAHYYAQHARLCAHWASTIDRPYMTIQYEELVRDFEGRLRWVIARSGLHWSRSCLEFYKQERAVMTFSAVQVRKPPSVEHLDSTSAYAGYLAAFDAALATYAVDRETGEWLQDGRTAAEEGAETLQSDQGGGLLAGLGRMFSRRSGGDSA